MNLLRAPLLCLLLCASAACAPDGVVNGRPYSLTLPSSSDGSTPLPLVILLHGFGANAGLQDFSFGISKAVEEKDFLFAQPNGTLDPKGRRFWNATDACCQPPDATVDVDDVAFLRAVIEDVRRRHPVSRVFLIGHSNGGFMALRMACEASDVIDGVVSVAGAHTKDEATCQSGAPVPVLQVHGTRDKVIKFAGGATDYGSYPGAAETVERFARRNGCGMERTVQAPIDIEAAEGAETLPESFNDCPKGGAVELWVMDQVGHLPSFNDRFPKEAFDWLSRSSR